MASQAKNNTLLLQELRRAIRCAGDLSLKSASEFLVHTVILFKIHDLPNCEFVLRRSRGVLDRAVFEVGKEPQMNRIKQTLLSIVMLFAATSLIATAGEPDTLEDVWAKGGYKCSWHKSWNGAIAGVLELEAPACNTQQVRASRCVGIIECKKGSQTYLDIANCPVKGDTRCSERDPHECIRNGNGQDRLLFNTRETKYFEDLAKATEERRDVSQSKPHVKR